MGWWKSDDRHNAGRDRVGARDRQDHVGHQRVREVQAEVWERPGPRSRLPDMRPRRPNRFRTGR
jgi:hypothetical protein